MVDLELVAEFVYENCENVSTSKNGTHFLARCPICGDSKKSLSKRRFNLDFNSGNPIWHCFNCGNSGSFIQLYSNIKGLSIAESLKELNKYNPDYLIQKLSNRKRKKVIDEIGYQYHDYILNDCVSLNEGVEGYVKLTHQEALKNFVKERGIKGNVYIAYKGKYQGRYIIPVYDESNHIVYFQARASNDSIKPKYKNPTLTKGSIIYNKHMFNSERYIVVCEGLLDAQSVGNQGTSCLGREINKNFINEIKPLTNKGIIVALDNDRDGMLSTLDLIENNISNVLFFLFPYNYRNCKDINQFSVSHNINKVYEFILENSYSSTSTYTKLHTEKWRKEIWRRREVKKK